MATKFGEWLQKEMDKRKWTQADLSRISKVSPSQITRVINGGRGIGVESIVGIARAFKIPEDIVFLASIGKGDKQHDQWVKEMTSKIDSLPPNMRRMVESFIDTMLNNGNE